MTTSWKNKKLKAFIQNTLGCGCPDKVFEKIDVSSYPFENHADIATRIVVGDTLLIYLVRTSMKPVSVDLVEALGLQGKSDRDSKRYNRFRLVFAGIDDDSQQESINRQFSKSFGAEEKMHIHFVKTGQVEGL